MIKGPLSSMFPHRIRHIQLPRRFRLQGVQWGHLTGFETFNFEVVSAELQFFVYPVRLFPSRDAIEPPVTEAFASCST